MNQYVTLIGSVEGVGNTLSRFTTRLPETLTLRKDKHEIGLAEIIFPISAQNFPKGGYYTIFTADGKQMKYYLRAGHYSNGKDLADGLSRKEAKSYAYFEFFPANQHMRIVVQKGTEKVEIEEDLAYAMGFTQAIFTKTTEAAHVVDKFNQQSIAYIYCDAVEPTIVGNVRAPLLQCVPIEGDFGSIRRVSFNPVRYLDVMHENIDQIRIELSNERGQPISFSFGSVILRAVMYSVPINVDELPWDELLAGQHGNGKFIGEPRMRGGMRGAGIGGILASIVRMIPTFLASPLGQQLTNTAGNIVNDITKGENVIDSAKRHGRQVIRDTTGLGNKRQEAMRLINEESKTTLLPEMDILSMPNSQVGALQDKWNKVNLKNGLNMTQGPFIFDLATGSKNFINLKRSWIVFTFQVTDATGKIIPDTIKTAGGVTSIPDLDDDGNQVIDPVTNAVKMVEQKTEGVLKANYKYAAVDGIAGALIRNMDLFINGSLVESGDLTAYRWHLENALSLSDEVRQNTLSLGGYGKGADDWVDESAPNFLSRYEMVRNGKKCQVACRIPLDIANVNRLIPAFTDIRLSLYLNNDRFLLDMRHSEDPAAIKIKMTDIYCLVNEWGVSEGYAAAVEKKLLTDGLHYPLNQVQMRSFYIEKDRTHSQHTVVFSGNQPKRLTLCLVSQAAFDGDFTKSPFKFDHYTLKNVAVDAGGVLYPGRPWNLDWKENMIAPGFIEMLEASGLARQNTTNSLSLDKFRNGCAIFSVELSPTCHDPETMDLLSQNMNISVHLEFQDKLPHGVYLIVMGEADGMLYIDPNRVPRINSL